jgi:hypothetical protein
MRKNKFFMIGMMSMVLVIGITIIGCTTIEYSVEISNVPNISEINIRNAGTTIWDTDMVRNWQNIDKSKFSETVDIRVIDTNGIVYTKYNVPFGDDDFVETEKRSVNMFVATY